MGLKLSLGVLDVPYADHEGVTTGDVAEWLEAEYEIMGTFYDKNAQAIADDLAASFEGELESIVMGKRAEPSNFFNAGTSKIETKFHQFLETGEMEKLGMEGIPTKAALRGVNHRLKAKRGKRRVSFIDTGLYDASFRAKVTIEGGE